MPLFFLYWKGKATQTIDKRLTVGHIRRLIADMPDSHVITPMFEHGHIPNDYEPGVILHGIEAFKGLNNDPQITVGLVARVSLTYLGGSDDGDGDEENSEEEIE